MSGRPSFSRRVVVLLGAAWGGTLAALGAVVLRGSAEPTGSRARWLAVGRVDEMPNGISSWTLEAQVRDAWSWRTVRRAVFVRREADHFTIFDRACPHLGCPVRWVAEQDEFHCPCHGGRFDAAGGRLAGPPRSGLRALPHRRHRDLLEVRWEPTMTPV